MTGGGTGTMCEFLNRLSRVLDMPIINEIEDANDLPISWIWYVRNRQSALHSFGKPMIKKILANISSQLSIDFAEARREIDVWSIKRGKSN